MIDVFAGSSQVPPPRSYGSRQILMCATSLVPLPPVAFNPIDEGEDDYEVEEPGDAAPTADGATVAATEDEVGPLAARPVAAVDSGTRVAAAAVVAVATASAYAVVTVASDTNTGDFLADDTISCNAPRLPGSPESS